MVARVDRDADDRANDPVVGKGLGPHRVHFKARGLGRGSLNLRALPVGDESEGGDDAEENDALHSGTIISNLLWQILP